MEYVVSTRITQLEAIDPGEIRRVQLALPDHIEIEGKHYPLYDEMRPGTAFLAKPWGSRTEKLRTANVYKIEFVLQCTRCTRDIY